MEAIRVFDDVFREDRREAIWRFLIQPGWKHGAYSGDKDKMPRYNYKHFAGYEKTGTEERELSAIADELRRKTPLLYEAWEGLTGKILQGQILSRCYANGMPVGIGGGVHRDSPISEHLTAIYYPQPTWSPNEGGETIFFDHAVSEVIKAVSPRPNRLVVFSGSIPHVARPIYGNIDHQRITLMYKTFGSKDRR